MGPAPVRALFLFGSGVEPMGLRHRFWFIGLVLALSLPVRAQPLMDWQPWQTLLGRAVVVERGGRASRVDYAYLSREKAAPNQLLKQAAGLERARFEQASREEQLAFLINLYNLATVDLVLSAYPNLTSIKDLGSFALPWQHKRVQLWGETLSLDDIEHDLIRGSGRYREPRIHFAVNCASLGCLPCGPTPTVPSVWRCNLKNRPSSFI